MAMQVGPQRRKRKVEKEHEQPQGTKKNGGNTCSQRTRRGE